eukprot:gnl/Chilomastix_cuspidata/3224.p1 GENE.gnl/Chilomastix_cuspidata/3224~~gnl/Chilomastix_cuspidata/3224.p1  ORF type:complete len:467 (+),score=105.78 gnl/Chilomastix_cuspidata/3224:129-1529(+)
MIGQADTQIPLTSDQVSFASAFAKHHYNQAKINLEISLKNVDVFQSLYSRLLESCSVVEDHNQSSVLFHQSVRNLDDLRLSCKLSITRSALAYQQIKNFPSADEEARTRETARQRFHNELVSQNAAIERLKERKKRLAAVASLRGVPTDTQTSSLVWNTLFEQCGTSALPDAFVAFPGVERLGVLHELFRIPLREANGVLVSERAVRVPLASALGLESRPEFSGSAFLSNAGLFCCPVGLKQILLFDFVSGTHKLLTAGRDPFACVFRSELFVCWKKQREMYHAPVADVLAGRELKDFSKFRLAGRFFWTACLDHATAGSVFFSDRNNSSQLVHVDLAERTSALISMGRGFPFVGGLSSINVPHTLCTMSSYIGATYALLSNGASSKVCDVQSTFPIILPSARAPHDLSCAAIFAWRSRMTYNNKTFNISTPITPIAQSFVRIFRDAFLTLDWHTKEWYVLRVVVP